MRRAKGHKVKQRRAVDTQPGSAALITFPFRSTSRLAAALTIHERWIHSVFHHRPRTLLAVPPHSHLPQCLRQSPALQLQTPQRSSLGACPSVFHLNVVVINICCLKQSALGTLLRNLTLLSSQSPLSLLYFEASSSGKFSFSRIESYRGRVVPWATIMVGMPRPWIWEMLTERSYFCASYQNEL